jgi:hypothetical protein
LRPFTNHIRKEKRQIAREVMATYAPESEEFFAGILCLAGLFVLAVQQSQASKGVPPPQAE